VSIKFGVVFTAVVLALALAPMTASAAETRTGDEIEIATGETITGDLYLFGGDVEIAGTVTGDVIGAVESLMVRGTVNGSLNIVARSIQINGRVDRSVRVAGDELIIRGSVGGDLMVAAGSTTLTSQGSVGGDLLLGGGDVSLSGSVADDVSGSASELNLGGQVGGSVSVSAAEINLTNRGRIAGDLRYASNNEIEILGAGDVAGTIERTGRLRAVGGPDLFTAATSQIVRLLVGLISGLVLIALFPMAAVRTADQIRRQFPIAAVSGLIGLIAWIGLALVLAITIVGIPIALIGTVLLLIVAWLSQVFAGLALGRAVLPGSWHVTSRGYNILAMAIGMIVIAALRSVPVPFISTAVAIISAIVAVGAVILAMRYDPERAW
jgi:cytoskeletal protein CcmA (bactofilin family)